MHRSIRCIAAVFHVLTMGEPGGFQIERIQIAREINALLNQFIGVLDAKASAFLAGNVAVGGFLLVGVGQAPWIRVVFFVALAAHAYSVLMSGAAIFPRQPKTGDSVLFWGDIAKSQSKEEYAQKFDEVLRAGRLDDQYVAQNYLTARLLDLKYRCLRQSIAWFFVALFASSVVFLASK